MELTLESGKNSRTHTCECCGLPYVSFTGFIYANNDAYAIYHAGLYESHGSGTFPMVSLGLGFADWLNADASDYSVGVEIRFDPDQYAFAFVDADTTPWHDSRVLGPMMSRNDALAHPDRQIFLQIAEYILQNDPVIQRFVEAQ